MADDSGPAFGFAVPKEYYIIEEGMSLRDWFAGQVMAEMIRKSEDHEGGWDPDDAAIGCYLMADAMLKARKGIGP
jgi:hypothetical protein